MASEDFCIERKLQNCVLTEKVSLSNGFSAMKMGGTEQLVLGHSGDDRGIDWGYFYLAADKGAVSSLQMAGQSLFKRPKPCLIPTLKMKCLLFSRMTTFIRLNISVSF